MDPIKEAFQRIKEEMNLLKLEIFSLKEELNDLKNCSRNPTNNLSHNNDPIDTPTQNQTVPQEMKGSKINKMPLSTGNEGVPTDNPTNRQAYRQTDFLDTIMYSEGYNKSLDNIQNTLDALDNIKKELRLKFKRLTTQEMLVFSTLYTLETKGIGEITYKTVTNNLNLSESSIRDYILKLMKKGVPIVKKRLNNKQIILQISENLKKIASLSTIIKLRDL
jgi:hypothetical protein